MIPSKNIPVDYEDARHRYSFKNKKYISASQIVEFFGNPFDGPTVAANYAEKHGQTAEYWLAKWKEKNEKSHVRGNYIHDANQVALEGRMIDKIGSRILPVHGSFFDDAWPWIERPDGVYLEKKVWHHGYRMAGRADKIILWTDPKTQVRYADIEDYKTNEKLEKMSYQFRNGTYKMMKPPIAHIMDSNWWHYQLQLSAYQFMMEYQGFAPGFRRIKHYPHPTEEKPNPVPEYHDVTYLKKEIVSMATWLNQKYGTVEGSAL